MKKIQIITLILLFALTLTACTKNSNIFGKTDDDGKYENNFFNFQLEISDSWKFFTDDERIVATESYHSIEFSDYTDIEVILLMIAYRDELKEEASNDSHGVEPHIHTSPILDPAITISAVKNKELPENLEEVTINDITMQKELVEAGTYYYFINNGYTVVITCVNSNEEDVQEITDMINTISLLKTDK